MRRYLEIWGIMLRNSLIREMSFKAKFHSLDDRGGALVLRSDCLLRIIFGQVDRIGTGRNGKSSASWHHQMIAQLFQALFFVNVSNIPELVRTANLTRSGFANR